MRPLSRIGLVFVAMVVILLLGVPAKADSITYTFTGGGTAINNLNGTDFTYVSPSGFLSFVPSCCSGPWLTPTTATDFIQGGIDSGPLTGFSFVNLGGDLLAFQVGSGSVAIGMMPFSLNVLGSQTLFDGNGNNLGTLDIANTPVPEPSSLVLLATGLGLLIFASRWKPRQIGCLG